MRGTAGAAVGEARGPATEARSLAGREYLATNAKCPEANRATETCEMRIAFTNGAFVTMSVYSEPSGTRFYTLEYGFDIDELVSTFVPGYRQAADASVSPYGRWSQLIYAMDGDEIRAIAVGTQDQRYVVKRSN